MMITLGMDSQFVFVDVGVTSLVDEYPVFFRQRWRKMLLTATWCIVGWLVGIPLTYNAGFYVFTIFDSYCAYYGLLLLSLSFVIAVAYCYNLLTTKFRLIENIKDMTGIFADIFTPTFVHQFYRSFSYTNFSYPNFYSSFFTNFFTPNVLQQFFTPNFLHQFFTSNFLTFYFCSTKFYAKIYLFLVILNSNRHILNIIEILKSNRKFVGTLQ